MALTERLTSGMTIKEMVAALVGNNPGAVTACIELVANGSSIDPDSNDGKLVWLRELDNLEIYEDRIWMLYNDVCGRDLVKMVAVLRAFGLGRLAGATRQAIDFTIDNWGKGLDLDAIVRAVKEELPNFGGGVSID